MVRLLARGLANREIATGLLLGEATIKTHVAHVLMKLGLPNRVQAVVFAYESGLIGARAYPRVRRGLSMTNRLDLAAW